MTKREFINALGNKLREGMTPSQIISQVRYYEGYIDGEIAKGKTEEEAVADLGDPILIARNILESPREEEDSFFGSTVQDQNDAYEEGSYQGENQHSEEEVRQAAREDIPLGETAPKREPAHEERKEEERHRAQEEERKESRNVRADAQKEADDPYNGSIPIHGEDEENASEEKRRHVSGTEAGENGSHSETENESPSGTGIFHDEHGRFRWDLLGVILAFALGLTAVIWLVTKIVTAMSPVAIIILLIIIVIFLLIHFKVHP